MAGRARVHEEDALLGLWPYMGVQLQTRLLGAHKKHGKLSVKKSVAALRGGSPVVARTVALIGQQSEAPGKSENSAPALESAAAKVPVQRPRMKCSPYVYRTCEMLLEKYISPVEGGSRLGEQKVSCEEFFLTLIESGASPLLLQWQEDGYDAPRIRQIFEQAKEDLDALHNGPATTTSPHPHGTTKSHSGNTKSYSGSEECTTKHGMKFIRSVSGSRVDKDIFLSYGREPTTAPFVSRLKSDLEGAGYSVWLDTVDIPSGSDWHSAIGDGLRRCTALIALITHKYIRSKYCKNEMFMADLTHKSIFPIFLEKVDFNSSEDAGVLYTISSINWIMLTSGMAGYDAAFSQLLEGMKSKGVTPQSADICGSSSASAGSSSECATHDTDKDTKTTQPSGVSSEKSGSDSQSTVRQSSSKKPLKAYSVSDVCLFVEQLELDSKLFKENSSGGEDLLELTDEDMKTELGLKPLQVRKLRRHIKSKLTEEPEQTDS